MIPEEERSRSLQWYHANRDHAIERMNARRRRQLERIRAIKLKSGCMDCGYAEHPDALEFDHREGTVKHFEIAKSMLKWSLLEAEMEKCDVVCANCHRVRTAERRAG